MTHVQSEGSMWAEILPLSSCMVLSKYGQTASHKGLHSFQRESECGGASIQEFSLLSVFSSLCRLQNEELQNTVASQQIASIFNYALNHRLPEGQAVFHDTFTYLKAALCEHRAGCLVY